MQHIIEIKKYQEGISNFTHLVLEAKQSHRKNLVCSITPVEKTQFGLSYVFDFSDNPLTSGLNIAIAPMPRKNQKKIDAEQERMNNLAETIAYLWNERNFGAIKALFA